MPDAMFERQKGGRQGRRGGGRKKEREKNPFDPLGPCNPVEESASHMELSEEYLTLHNKAPSQKGWC